MPIPETPRSIPSLKYFLFSAYVELKKVESEVYGYNWPSELSNIEKAVIILEDRRFFGHSGIDFRSVMRELYKRMTFRRHGGASTIEMQFVRTCTGFKEFTLRRKIFEMYMAWALAHRVSKLEVLRSYLRLAYLGSGLCGVDEASQKMFGIYSDDLNPEQASIIASMLVYPRPVEPNESWNKKIQRRAQYGLRLLAKHRDHYWK